MNGNGKAVSAGFRNAGLPADLNALARGMAEAASAGAGGTLDGRQLLKLDKGDGSWLYGAEGTEVEEGAVLAIDPTSFQHGWIRWVDGKVDGERMASVADPRPAGEGDEQLAFHAVITNGADKGTELVYKTTAHGGKEAVRNLMKGIAQRMAAGEATIVPLVSLGNESYRHKQYGKIWKPVFIVENWAALTGAVETAKAPEPEPEPEPPRRRRRVV